MAKRWEIGSEFEWSEKAIFKQMAGDVVEGVVPSLQTLLPKRYEMFSTGTAILFSIYKMYQARQNRLRLHLPSFFCMHVASKLKAVAEISWYQDLPTEPTPDFNSLHPSPGDLIVAVNLFGIRQQNPWKDWLHSHDDIILIEDHTHDPFSTWARQSTAHYAMASLRKTLPIPDGAILWSNQELELPLPSPASPWGAYYKLMAMLLKQSYLDGAKVSKDAYRFLQTQGEQYLSSEDDTEASFFTTHIINCLNILELRQQREANIKQFLEIILTERNSDWKPLFTSWLSGSVPFNSVIICKNKVVREALRKHLLAHNIFPAVHWQQPLDGFSSADSAAIDLSNRILTIPTDYRYSSLDIQQIINITSKFNCELSTI